MRHLTKESISRFSLGGLDPVFALGRVDRQDPLVEVLDVLERGRQLEMAAPAR